MERPIAIFKWQNLPSAVDGMADIYGLDPYAERRGGSSPPLRTNCFCIDVERRAGSSPVSRTKLKV